MNENNFQKEEEPSSILMSLEILSGGTLGKVFVVEEGANLIGRWDPDNNSYPEIDLEHEDFEARVSRKHAVIDRQGDKATIEDVGSLNGTFLNKTKRLQKGLSYQLNDGDEVAIGKTVFRFHIETAGK